MTIPDTRIDATAWKFIKEIDPMIEAWTEKHTKHEAMRILADEHLKQKGFIVELERRSTESSSRWMRRRSPP